VKILLEWEVVNDKPSDYGWTPRLAAGNCHEKVVALVRSRKAVISSTI